MPATSARREVLAAAGGDRARHRRAREQRQGRLGRADPGRRRCSRREGALHLRPATIVTQLDSLIRAAARFRRRGRRPLASGLSAGPARMASCSSTPGSAGPLRGFACRSAWAACHVRGRPVRGELDRARVVPASFRYRSPPGARVAAPSRKRSVSARCSRQYGQSWPPGELLVLVLDAARVERRVQRAVAGQQADRRCRSRSAAAAAARRCASSQCSAVPSGLPKPGKRRRADRPSPRARRPSVVTAECAEMPREAVRVLRAQAQRAEAAHRQAGDRRSASARVTRSSASAAASGTSSTIQRS